MDLPASPPTERFQPAQLDRKSLELHRLAVQKIRRDPELFRCVQENLDRWCQRADQATRPQLVAWQDFVDQDLEATLSIALEESERGQVLRQASPFAGVLTEAERLEFLKTWVSVK